MNSQKATKQLFDCPAHWQLKPLKHLAKVTLGKMLTTQDKGSYLNRPYLRAQNIRWEKVDVADVNTMWFSEDELSLYRLEHGDILVSEGGEVGRSAIWRSEIPECYIQNSVHKVTTKPDVADPDFLLYCFEAYGKTGLFDSIVNRISIAHLTKEKLTNISFHCPSLPEQQRIAGFLRERLAYIDDLISKKQRMIELLAEERQAILNEAVRKGINPNVKLKPSGIEWIGDVPEHWRIKKLKWFASTTSGGTPNTNHPEYYDGCIPWFRSTDLNDGELTSADVCITELALKDTSCKMLPSNAVLIAMYGGEGTIGKNAITRLDATCNQAVCAIVPGKECDPDFLLLFMKFYRPVWMRDAVGTRRDPNISQDIVREAKILLPPVNEQQRIVSHVNHQLAVIEGTVSSINASVSLLQEYRTALITEAVTGKLDIPALA